MHPKAFEIAGIPKPQPDAGRRRFITNAIYAIWGLIAAALGIPASMYLMLPPQVRREDEWVEAGDTAGLESGAPTQIVFRRNQRDGWKLTSQKSTAWVVKSAENRFVAFAPQCTHLGCAYHWDERQREFICPCHASSFGLDGKVLSGPAPRPLDRYDVRLQDKKLLIGRIRRSDGAEA